MRWTKDELEELLKRVRDASATNFPLACADLFQYLDERVPDNSAYLEFQRDRTERWATFQPASNGAWEMPNDRAERLSLAYDLFRTVAERKDTGDGLLWQLYREDFPQNVRRFRSDFLQHLVDALNKIWRTEPHEVSVTGREKQQKFRILDSPTMLEQDISAAPGRFGRVIVYFDLDDFKAINTRFTECVVDECVLPVVQRLVVAATLNQGFAYAEGGDEMTALLLNATLSMGAAFANSLRRLLEATPVDVHGEQIFVTASFGVATEKEDANVAKNFAKANGKNCVAVSRNGSAELWRDPFDQH